MGSLLDLLAAQPVLLLMILLAVGSVLGAVRFQRVQLGPAAVLFAAIGVAAAGASADVPLVIPEVVGTLGLVLFTYTVGIVSGPSFSGFDTRVGLGYALVYPAAMIAKILIAQLLAGLPG